MKRMLSATVAACLLLVTCLVGGAAAVSAASIASHFSIPPSSSTQFNAIDISHYNTISWSTLDSRVGVIYMKATEGTGYTDTKLASNVAGAESRSIRYGFYHYLDFSEDAAQQAEYFYNQISKYGYSCIPALDIEWDSRDNIYSNNTPAGVRQKIQAFVNRFEQLSGQSIMVYCNVKMTQYLAQYPEDYDVSFLKNLRLWLSSYKNEPTVTFPQSPVDLWGSANAGAASTTTGNVCIWDHYDMWQYTENMSITGSSDGVDGDWATDVIFTRIIPAKNQVNLVSGARYYIRSKSSGKYLDVRSGQNYDGNQIQQYSFNATASQEWILTADSNGLYTLTSATGNRVLDISGGTSQDGAKAQLWSANDSYAQKFLLSYHEDDNSFSIFTGNTGAYKVLDIPGASTASGMRLQQYTYNGSDAQRFYLEKVSTFPSGLAGSGTSTVTDGTYYIKNANSGLLLTLKNNNDADGQQVVQDAFNGLNGQQWKLTTDEDGNMTIQPLSSTSNKVLDIVGGSARNGALLQLFTSNSSKAQKFRLSKNINGTFSILTGTTDFSAGSKKVLDVPGGSLDTGVALQQYDANGTAAQQFVLVSTALNTASVSSAASLVSGKSYYIQSAQSGLFLTPENGQAGTDGTGLVQALRTGLNTQKWVLTVNTDGSYTIQNSDSQKVLDVSAAADVDGAFLNVYSSNGSKAQKWMLSWGTDGTVEISPQSSSSSGRVLDVAGGSSNIQTAVRLWSSNGTGAQKWKLIPVD